MKAKDIVIVSAGILLTFGGIAASFLGSVRVSISALLLLGLLILFLLVLQRRHQGRVQERILYLVNSERTRNKSTIDQNSLKSLSSSNAIFADRKSTRLNSSHVSISYA